MPKQSRTSRQGRSAAAAVAIPEGAYLCESILDLKIERGQRHYLIKWKGYDDPCDNTWEPLSNLENLLEDLLQYEQAHATRIRKVEDHWRKMHRDGKVAEPLQEMDVAAMQHELDRYNELSTPESTPPRRDRGSRDMRKAKTREHKGKQIAKQEKLKIIIPPAEIKRELRSKDAVVEVKQQVKARKRGRKSKPNIASKIEEIYIVQSPNLPLEQSENEARDLSFPVHPKSQPQLEEEPIVEQSRHFLTPERPIIVEEDVKNTKSQERPIKLENHSDEEPPKDPEQKAEREQGEKERPLEEEQEVRQQEKAVEEVERKERACEQALREHQQLNNEINSYFEDFSSENAVVKVLSRRLSPQKPTPPAEPPEEAKRESIFKNASKYIAETSRGGCASSLHSGSKKYLIYRKRKPILERSESESDSHHSILKGFQNNPIIELEEEQKESSPLSNAARPCKQEEQAEPDAQQDQVMVEENTSPKPVHNQQIEQSIPPVPEVVAEVEEKPEQAAQLKPSEPDQPQQPVVNAISEEGQVEPIQEQPPVKCDLANEIGKEVELEGIQAILDRFHKTTNSPPYIPIDSERLPRSPPRRTIDIDQDSDAQPQEEEFKFTALPKKKRIRKEGRSVQRGIVGCSQESLLRCGEDVHYRPSLNTVFQNLLSESEVRLLEGVNVVRLLSCFRMENVILFAAHVLLPHDLPATRFLSYQALREHFPRQLLAFLEDNAMIDL